MRCPLLRSPAGNSGGVLVCLPAPEGRGAFALLASGTTTALALGPRREVAAGVAGVIAIVGAVALAALRRRREEVELRDLGRERLGLDREPAIGEDLADGV